MLTLTPWALTLMLTLRPSTLVRASGLDETQAQREARYAEIAQAVDDVVRESPALVPGDYGKAYTATVLLALTYVESGWRKDVDLGLNRDKRAAYGQEDHGRSWCMGQINIDKGNVVVGDDVMKSWKGPDLIADRRKCFKVVLEHVRRSFASCRSLPKEQWLNQYASGECKPNPEECIGRKDEVQCLAKKERKYADASRKSRARMMMATRLFVQLRPTAPKDSELVLPPGPSGEPRSAE